MTPYYSKPPLEGVRRHFGAIADSAGDLPLVALQHPAARHRERRSGLDHPDRGEPREPRGRQAGDARPDAGTARSSRPGSRSTRATTTCVLPFLELGGCGGICVASHLVGRASSSCATSSRRARSTRPTRGTHELAAAAGRPVRDGQPDPGQGRARPARAPRGRSAPAAVEASAAERVAVRPHSPHSASRPCGRDGHDDDVGRSNHPPRRSRRGRQEHDRGRAGRRADPDRCGSRFPRDEMLGVDLVLPDFGVPARAPGTLRAVILTHGHEDHVGGLPYLMREVGVPEVWGTRLTLGLIKSKLDEHGLMRPREAARDRARAASRSRSARSRPSSSASRTRSPTPSRSRCTRDQGTHRAHRRHQARPHADRRPPHRPAPSSRRLGEDGVARSCWPTPRTPSAPGRRPRASGRRRRAARIVRDAPGRVIVTSFASHIHRLQEVIDAAEACDRRVCVVGRSMTKNLNIARNLGYAERRRRACWSSRAELDEPRAARGDDPVHRLPGRAALGADAHRLRRPPRRSRSSRATP